MKLSLDFNSKAALGFLLAAALHSYHAPNAVAAQQHKPRSIVQEYLESVDDLAQQQIASKLYGHPEYEFMSSSSAAMPLQADQYLDECLGGTSSNSMEKLQEIVMDGYSDAFKDIAESSDIYQDTIERPIQHIGDLIMERFLGKDTVQDSDYQPADDAGSDPVQSGYSWLSFADHDIGGSASYNSHGIDAKVRSRLRGLNLLGLAVDELGVTLGTQDARLELEKAISSEILSRFEFSMDYTGKPTTDLQLTLTGKRNARGQWLVSVGYSDNDDSPGIFGYIGGAYFIGGKN